MLQHRFQRLVSDTIDLQGELHLKRMLLDMLGKQSQFVKLTKASPAC